MVDLARKVRGKINAIRIIDGDGKLSEHGVHSSKRLGAGLIDFAPCPKELIGQSGCPHNWWIIDLCFENEVWPKAKQMKSKTERRNALYGRTRNPRERRWG